MKKWGTRILKALGLAIFGYLVFAMFAPSNYKIERSKKIGASVEIIYEQIAYFENWELWSPWKEKDTSLVYSFGGEPGTIGSKSSWIGNPKITGVGSMIITQLIENSGMSYDLKFDDRAMTSKGWIEIKEGKHTSEVIWTDQGDIPFLFRPIAMLSDIESQISPYFERGLQLLDSVAELHQKEHDLLQSNLTNENNLLDGFENLLARNDSIDKKNFYRKL